jgi:hypothetical protein
MQRLLWDTAATADHVRVGRAQKLTRAQRRERRETVPVSGVYGVDAWDAGADNWIGRYVFWAKSADEAKTRTRDAGFHRKQIQATWTPGHQPSEGIPSELRRGDAHWYRSRFEDSGWTSWDRLSPDYRHPPQGLAAEDPSIR